MLVSLFDSAVASLVERGEALAREIAALPLEDQVAALNGIRRALHEAGPFREQPVDCVLWVPAARVRANGYNPNTVAPPEMRLLVESIRADGYTQPVVAYTDPQPDRDLTVVDGFHRLRVASEVKDVRTAVRGYLPVTEIRTTRHNQDDRMASTIRHNRARGRHGVAPMSAIVAELVQAGWPDERIARELGMDRDEVLRMKQVTGLAALFADQEFSEAWEEGPEPEPAALASTGALVPPEPRCEWEERTGRRYILESQPGELLARVTKSANRPGWNWTVYGPPMRKGYAATREEAMCGAESVLLAAG